MLVPAYFFAVRRNGSGRDPVLAEADVGTPVTLLVEDEVAFAGAGLIFLGAYAPGRGKRKKKGGSFSGLSI